MRGYLMIVLLNLGMACFAKSATCPVLITKVLWQVPTPYDTRAWPAPFSGGILHQVDTGSTRRYAFLSSQSYFGITFKNTSSEAIERIELRAILIGRNEREQIIPFSYQVGKISAHKKHSAILPTRLNNADEFDDVRVSVREIKFYNGSIWINADSQDCLQLRGKR